MARVANISLSPDERVAGDGGYDMSWTVRHAVSDGAATPGPGHRHRHHGAARPQELPWLRRLLAPRGRGRGRGRFATADPAATVKQLRQQDGGDIIVLASISATWPSGQHATGPGASRP